MIGSLIDDPRAPHRRILVAPDLELGPDIDLDVLLHDDPETGDDQGAQRPDGCAGCLYLPGPDVGVRVAAASACPIHR